MSTSTTVRSLIRLRTRRLIDGSILGSDGRSSSVDVYLLSGLCVHKMYISKIRQCICHSVYQKTLFGAIQTIYEVIYGQWLIGNNTKHIKILERIECIRGNSGESAK